MKPICTAAASLIIAVCYSAPSHAYLDPGSGSLMLQVLLGGIAGLVVAGKLFWTRILTFLGFKKGDQPDPQDKPED